MKFAPGNLYHIYNQGNNKEQIFLCDEDYLIFIRLIRKLISPHAEILAYCLMPNHFHLMIYADERVQEEIKQGGIVIDPVTNGLRKLLSGYARIFNEKYNRSGSLFRQKTKAKNLSENLIIESASVIPDYYSECFNYIHRNPRAGGLVKDLKDWQYSSYPDFAGLRKGNLCNKKLALKYCCFIQ